MLKINENMMQVTLSLLALSFLDANMIKTQTNKNGRTCNTFSTTENNYSRITKQQWMVTVLILEIVRTQWLMLTLRVSEYSCLHVCHCHCLSRIHIRHCKWQLLNHAQHETHHGLWTHTHWNQQDKHIHNRSYIMAHIKSYEIDPAGTS